MIYDHSQCIRTQVYVDGNFKNARIYTTADYLTANHIINRSLQPYSGVLVIHHVPTDPQGRDFYHEFKSAIPFMEAYVGYTTFETDSIPSYWVSSCNQMDEIWVPSKFNLETFGNAGVAKDKLYVIPHGFDPKRYAPDTTRPLNFGSKSKFTFLSVFEWTYRKGWDVLIRAFIEEFAPHENVRLLIRTYMGGGVIGPQTESVSTQFKNYIRDLGFNHNNIPTIEFIDTTIPDQLMPNLYKTADVFVLPTRGEGWGIPFTESMLMEVPVIGTKWGGQLEFMNEDNAYLIEVDKIVPVSESQVKDSPFYKGHKWAEPSVEHLRKLMRRVFKDPEEAKEKAKKARKWILDNYTIYHTAIKIAKRVEALRNSKVRPTAKCKSRKNVNLKVLFQSRSDMFTLPGGDTEVLLNLKYNLENLGCTVDYSPFHNVDLSNYDIVHIFNCHNLFAVNCAVQGKHYVLTPMYEDIQKYYVKSLLAYNTLKNICLGSTKTFSFDCKLPFFDSKLNHLSFREFEFLMENASSIIVSGTQEEMTIKRDYPSASYTNTLKLGFKKPDNSDSVSEDLFYKQYGLTDFVLCVARLETRKNQLMLLYALQDVDIPIVFINSGSTQLEYEHLCKTFKRKATTLFLGRVNKYILLSAYKAAKVHALPSWYELPGLVTLEAAWLGCNVVATDWGTISDYLGENVFYCTPNNPDSIRDAVLKAYNSAKSNNSKIILENLSWSSYAENILAIYDSVISSNSKRNTNVLNSKVRHEIRYHKLRGEAVGCVFKEPNRAIELANQLIKLKPNDPIGHYVKGTGYLLFGNYSKAISSLEQAIQLKPYLDIKVYLYLCLALLKVSENKRASAILDAAVLLFPFINSKLSSIIREYYKLAETPKSRPFNNYVPMGIGTFSAS